MIQPLNNKIIFYSSLFITAAIGLPRLLLWQHGQSGFGPIPFNFIEWVVQFVISLFFCITVFFSNRLYIKDYNTAWDIKIHGIVIFINLTIFTSFVLIGGLISRLFIQSHVFPLNGNLFRFLIAIILMLIEMKIIAVVWLAQQKEHENNELRNANATMELQLLKSQLNPHFLFNALSSLTAVVRENPIKAQRYIFHLSQIFRYSLTKPHQSLVSLQDELQELNSYIELIKMRHENGFIISIGIEAQQRLLQLPHMSLQPLIENALKHNIATLANPLFVEIVITNGYLVVGNNLQPKKFPEAGAGIGLVNLNERCKILLQNEIEIEKTSEKFTVKIPLHNVESSNYRR